jgi:hypothetical protein
MASETQRLRPPRSRSENTIEAAKPTAKPKRSGSPVQTCVCRGPGCSRGGRPRPDVARAARGPTQAPAHLPELVLIIMY